MRLWSLNPKYLDSKGLVALWRESLLALKVLEGKTKGYKNHPQLNRFKQKPIESLKNYLYFIWEEAKKREYNFDGTKIKLDYDDWIVDCPNDEYFINVTKGQLKYEFNWLQRKLETRDNLMKLSNEYYHSVNNYIIEAHPLFKIVKGEIESWEKVNLKMK